MKTITKKESYSEIISKDPEMTNCFFAFSDSQFNEAVIKHKLQDEKILSAGHGLYGTSEGIRNFFDAYEVRSKKVTDTCDPQAVYKYEFGNHECSYTCDDTEAIKIVIDYFGEEKARIVKRRFAYYKF